MWEAASCFFFVMFLVDSERLCLMWRSCKGLLFRHRCCLLKRKRTSETFLLCPSPLRSLSLMLREFRCHSLRVELCNSSNTVKNGSNSTQISNEKSLFLGAFHDCKAHLTPNSLCCDKKRGHLLHVFMSFTQFWIVLVDCSPNLPSKTCPAQMSLQKSK